MNKLNKDNKLFYLYSDALFLKSINNFKPEKQWILLMGDFLKEESLFRYFFNIKTIDDFLYTVIVPSETCYDSFYIYDHNYVENKTIEIKWKDMIHTYSLNALEGKIDLKNYFTHTKGKILKQTKSHILLEVEEYLKSSKRHEKLQSEYKYISIPKSYVFSIKDKDEWKYADLKLIKPYIDKNILDGDTGIYGAKNMRNFREEILGQNESCIFYSFNNSRLHIIRKQIST